MNGRGMQYPVKSVRVAQDVHTVQTSDLFFVFLSDP